MTRSQLRALGLSKDVIQHRVRAGVWTNVDRRVIEVVGLASDAFMTACWHGVLVSGELSAVAYEAAGRIHRWESCRHARATVMVPHGHHVSCSRARVRQSRRLRDTDIVTRSGLPVVRAARTILDLSRDVGRARLASCVDDALASGQCDLVDIGHQLRRFMSVEHRGLMNVATILDERAQVDGPTDSRAERMLAEALCLLEGPDPVTQYPHPSRRREGRVDLAFPAQRIIVEVDHRRWHTRVADLKRDAARDLEAAEEAWQTLRIPSEFIEADVNDVAASVQAAVAGRTPRPE